MSITVTEKDHWKNRLERRIDRRIAALLTASSPGFLDHVAASAKERAKAALGIDTLLEEAKELTRQSQELQRRADKSKLKAYWLAKGLPEDATEDSFRLRYELDGIIESHAKPLRTSIMEETLLGRQILRLEAEKEEMLDTIWLATSPKQIKELWESLETLLDSTPTELQQKALRCDPDQ